jgi:hypothetical protein
MADGGAALPPASAASAFPDFIVSPRYRIIKRLGKGTFGAVVYVCCPLSLFGFCACSGNFGVVVVGCLPILHVLLHVLLLLWVVCTGLWLWEGRACVRANPIMAFSGFVGLVGRGCCPVCFCDGLNAGSAPFLTT